ncbi:MAG: hypothetical protein EPO58_16030 [Chitinophagaceae bacterium]|nr:MAG: hypothetical protein EPO58_16030 [Chitinophagaceae bacterium]
MAKLKKISVQPLTPLEALDLKVASTQHVDVSELPGDVQAKLHSDLMKIAQKSEGVIVINSFGETPFVSTVMRTSKEKKKFYAFPEPNPVHLYYKIGIGHLEAAEIKKKEFTHMHGAHPEKEFEGFGTYFESLVTGIVFMLMTMEGFVNQLLSEGAVYAVNGNEKSKADVEWMNLTDKIMFVVPEITGIDFRVTNAQAYGRITKLNEIRNELIHLKKVEAANFTIYQDLFKQLLDFQILESADAVFEFVTTLKPGYFKEQAE